MGAFIATTAELVGILAVLVPTGIWLYRKVKRFLDAERAYREKMEHEIAVLNMMAEHLVRQHAALDRKIENTVENQKWVVNDYLFTMNSCMLGLVDTGKKLTKMLFAVQGIDSGDLGTIDGQLEHIASRISKYGLLRLTDVDDNEEENTLKPKNSPLP